MQEYKQLLYIFLQESMYQPGARRQWDLVDNLDLKYHFLGDFDREMLELIGDVKNFQDTPIQKVWDNDGDQILAYMRKDLVFVFNFSPTKSFTDYGFLVPKGEYEVVLNTDATRFGGFGLADDTIRHFTQFDPLYKKEKKEWLKTLSGVALGSDAFFPFGDNIERARRSGVTAIVQPGGSIRDQQVIDTCNKYGIAMAFCGLRLFHH